MPPMSSQAPAQEVEADVMVWAATVIPALPHYDTEEYETMIYFDLESIRNSGLAAYQYLPDFVEDLRPAVETMTDLLTTVRYGRAPGRPLSYIRTGYVPGLRRPPFGYPEHVLDDCCHGLRKLNEHKDIFLAGASPVLERKFTEFARAVEMLVSECLMD